MSLLTPSVQVLDKGLNLQTAKLLAPPGSVLDSLNYEQVDFQGQKRIDGYAAYDGRTLADKMEVMFLENDPNNNSSLVVDNNDVFFGGVLIGTLVGMYMAYYMLAVEDYTALQELNFLTYEDVGVGAEEYQDLLNDANNLLRNRTEPLPGSVSGLHWFGDRLYAVADVAAIHVEVVSEVRPVQMGDTAEFLMGTEPNTYYVEGHVLGYETGPEETHILYVGVAADVGDSDGNITVTYNGAEVMSGTVLSTYPMVDADKFPASLFESRTPEQTKREDVDYDFHNTGWRFFHQGWEVRFEDGNVPYGSLTALNQNRQGVGVEGPTSTSGTNGTPSVATQASSITGKAPQINGWKSSHLPTEYTLVPKNVQELDGSTIYADAFFSWEGGAITSPSHNDTLEYNSPTNTIQVEDLS